MGRQSYTCTCMTSYFPHTPLKTTKVRLYCILVVGQLYGHLDESIWRQLEHLWNVLSKLTEGHQLKVNIYDKADNEKATKVIIGRTAP